MVLYDLYLMATQLTIQLLLRMQKEVRSFWFPLPCHVCLLSLMFAIFDPLSVVLLLTCNSDHESSVVVKPRKLSTASLEDDLDSAEKLTESRNTAYMPTLTKSLYKTLRLGKVINSTDSTVNDKRETETSVITADNLWCLKDIISQREEELMEEMRMENAYLDSITTREQFNQALELIRANKLREYLFCSVP
eukprot:Colp12_sorted_trinity150504_noHs@21100